MGTPGGRRMEQGKCFAYGGSSSSQGIDGASGLLRQLFIDPRGVTPLSLARQSKLPQIVQSMREMEQKHNESRRRRFQLPLRTSFVKAVRSLQLPEPEFSVVQRRNCFQITITLTLGSKSADVVGDLCETFEAADSSAIRNALDKIVAVENVALVDISRRKEKDLIRTGKQIYFKTLSLFGQVQCMMKTWIECMETISKPLDFARGLLQGGNEVDKQSVDSIMNHLLLIRGASTVQINALDANMKALCDEKFKYAAGARAQPFPKVPAMKVKFDDVDALALLVQWLGLPECQYSANIGDKDRYLGGVQFTFSSGETENPYTVWIFAKEHKRTIAKADNAAAREGIYYLEGRFNVDVVGYNHQRAIIADQENFVWKGLKQEIIVFGESVSRAWEDMVDRLDDCIEEDKKQCRPAVMGIDMDGLFRHLDYAASRCKESFKVIFKYILLLLYWENCHVLYCSEHGTPHQPLSYTWKW